MSAKLDWGKIENEVAVWTAEWSRQNHSDYLNLHKLFVKISEVVDRELTE